MLLNHLIKADNIWVLQQFHDLYFSCHFLPVLFVQPGLVNDFHSNLNTRRVMRVGRKGRGEGRKGRGGRGDRDGRGGEGRGGEREAERGG